MATRHSFYRDLSPIDRFSDCVVKARRQDATSDSDLVAVKIVKFQQEDDSFRKQAVREIVTLWKQANHCSIVQVFLYTKDISSHSLFVEMEYCQDGNLASAIIEQHYRPFDYEQLRNWFAQIVLALHFLHEALRLVHRNIKPSNIFLATNRTRVKLGLPTFTQNKQDDAIFSQSMLPYMSLQQLEGQIPHFKDDIWSIGVLLFQLTTFQLPFAGELGTVPVPRHASLISAIKRGDWLCELGSSVPRCVKNLLPRLLKVKIEERLSMSELLAHDFLRGALVPFNPLNENEPNRDPEPPKNQSCEKEDNSLSVSQIATPSCPQQQGKESLLSKTTDLFLRSKEQQLVDAAYWGDTALVAELLDAKEPVVSIEAKDASLFGNGSTALIFASEFGHSDTVRLLLERGANVEAKDGRCMTPLIAASTNGYLKCVKLLVRLGRAVVEQRNDGGTALVAASLKGHVEIVKYLIDNAGANIEARNNNGSTPLIVASFYCHAATVRALLERGADINAETNKGKTALAVSGGYPLAVGAVKQMKGEIVRLLTNRGIRY